MKKMSAIFAFFMLFFGAAFASEKVINVFLIGPGLVGSELIHQIDTNFSSDKPIEVRVVGLATSQTMFFDPNGIVLSNWKEQLAQGEAMSLDAFISRMLEMQLPHSVFVDCTSSQTVADIYAQVLGSHIAVVTPNKKANSGSFATYSQLHMLSSDCRVPFLYDANVGAGLPFIRTIQTLKRSGDAVVRLEAILSGTLSYLFNTFDGSVPFSEVVLAAQKQGYTEPDPRDDLNGMDMARKFLILAREAGLPCEMSDIVVESFLPDDCFEAATVAEFYEKLQGFDATMIALVQEAKQNGQVLRFIGMLENGKATLSLKAVDAIHPFYQLSDTNNIASIKSRHYSKNPIVIKGPGAGASLTAANVLSNVIEAGD